MAFSNIIKNNNNTRYINAIIQYNNNNELINKNNIIFIQIII